MTLNRQKREAGEINGSQPKLPIDLTHHALYVEDSVEFLTRVPDSSVDLVILDPPYNLEMDVWDKFDNYLEWAKSWMDQISRILTDTGNCVIFGGFQYQELKKGDLLEILHYARHGTDLRFVNLVIWYYKNGMSAHRFFANRHEEAIWLAKTRRYYFDLDAVRVPFDDETKERYSKDKRLNPESLEKGKNPTNVWEIGRLNGNSKERVGHPTQKPLEVIRRFVRGLSKEGAVVLDFFAGSGTTGRVCAEEGRHSILVDSDPAMIDYFAEHMSNSQPKANFRVHSSPEVNGFIEGVRNRTDSVTNNSKALMVSTGGAK